MSQWSFASVETGRFSGRTFSGSAKLLRLNTPAGHIAIEGHYDSRTQRVDVVALEAARGDHSPPSDFVVAYQRPQIETDAEQQASRDRQARQRIDELERAQRRPVRELLIDPTNVAAKQRLAEIDAEIAVLRSDLVQRQT